MHSSSLCEIDPTGSRDTADVQRARLVSLRKYRDDRGLLMPIEAGKDIPFVPHRSFIISQVPPGKTRGSHAHRSSDEFLLAIKGGVQVTLRDGAEERSFILDNQDQGLLIPPLVWVELKWFTADALILALASSTYDEADYITDYDSYLSEVRG